MFERDLLFRELSGLNREDETAARDYFLDPKLNGDPSAIIDEAAVKVFNADDRAFLYAAPLPHKRTFVSVRKDGKRGKVELPSIERAVKKNSPANNKLLGVDVPAFLDRLKKYVDFQAIEQALMQKYPQLVIDKQTALNEVAVEAVHQFQAKIFIDPADWDGVVGPTVLSSLGFVFHEGKRFTARLANDKIKKVFAKIDQRIKDYVAASAVGLPDITGRNWFDFIVNPSIFGQAGSKGFGFHLLLILKLRAVENDLYAPLAAELTTLFDREISATHNFKGKTYGQVPRLLGKALGINEKHGDIRSVSDGTPFSRHLSGMAIDLNHAGNPWVRDAQGLQMINRALKNAKKTVINARTFPTAQLYFADLAKNNDTAAVFDRLKADSDDCVNFLRLNSVNWGGSRRSPNRGFLNLRKELVVALRDAAGLAWGAVDLGRSAKGNGDMMHFDMRTSSIGQAYSYEIGQDEINDYLKTVRPNFERIVFETKPKTAPPKKAPPKKDKESAPGGERGWPNFERDLLVRELETLGRDFSDPPLGPAVADHGLDLKRGDNDKKRVFEGKKRADVKGNPVEQLQKDLQTVGIGLIAKPDGDFGLNTEFAVREFQIYAKMPRIAGPVSGVFKPLIIMRNRMGVPKYGDELEAVPNSDKYKGKIDGVAGGEVRRLLRKWLANSWRIPVIVQAWTMKRGRRDKIFRKKDNIWKFDEVTSNAPRMFVRDLSGYYTFPAGRDADSVVVGDGAGGGPEARTADHSWTESEFSAQDVFKKGFDKLAADQKSTFKIVRAIAEVESNDGFLDRINAADSAFVSYGPFHWTLDSGEFPSFLAFLKDRSSADFEKAASFFGIQINKDWNGSGQDLFMSGSQRKFGNGRLKVSTGGGDKLVESADKSWCNYFRSWHFFYRFVMAARTIPAFRSLTYDFAKMRIKAVRDIPINNFGFTDSKKKAVNPTIGEIFNSEKSFAMVLRVHVFRPAWVGGVTSELDNPLRIILRDAFAKIKEPDFSKWTQKEERFLIDALLKSNRYPSRKTDVHNTLARVDAFRYETHADGNLSENRGSFNFEDKVPTLKY